MTYTRPKSLSDSVTHYCPGCGHGIVQRIITEVIDELNIQNETIGVAPIGCSVFIYNYIQVNFVEPPHGRAPAAASGIKRILPKKIVFTYQGDGDLAGIGTSEIIHTANRGEKITVIFINNGIYGMTGGQMAPTTISGQKTTTTMEGRKNESDGNPIKMLEMIAQLEVPTYLERTALFDPINIRRTKTAIKKAFQNQIDNKCFSLIEVLSNCSTNWKMSINESNDFIKEKVVKTYPLGVIKNVN